MIGLYVRDGYERETSLTSERRYLYGSPLEAAESRLADLKGLRDTSRSGNDDLIQAFMSRISRVHRYDLDDMDQTTSASSILRQVVNSATLDDVGNIRYRLNVPDAPHIYASTAEMEADGYDMAHIESPSAWT